MNSLISGKQLTTIQKIKKIIYLLAKLCILKFYNDIRKEQINLRFWYILTLSIGVLSYFFFDTDYKLLIILIATIIIILSILCNIIFNKNNAVLIKFCSSFCIGFIITFIHYNKVNNDFFHSPLYNITFEGKIESIKLTSEENVLILKATHAPYTELYKGKIRIKYNPSILEQTTLNNGDILKITTSLIPIKYSDFPQDKSYENYAKFLDIIASGTAKNIEIISQNRNNNFLDKLKPQNYRNKIQQRIYNVNHHSSGAGIVIAVLTGNNSFISKKQLSNIRRSGCAHILAISGLHMSIVVSFIYAIFIHIFALFPKIALRYNTKKLAVFPAIIVCLFYLNIANIPISATRSCLMVLIASVSLLINRHNASLNTLFITFLTMLITSPYYILSPSFQMSFMAVFGLITMYHNVFISENLIFSRNKTIIKYISGILFSSIIATISTMFFEIYHFKQYAWIGLISNIPVIPLTEFLVLPFGFIGMIFNATWFGDICYAIAGFFGNLVCIITDWTANLPYSFLLTHQMSNQQLSLIIFGIITIFLSLSKIIKIFGATLFTIGLLSYLQEPPYVLIYSQNLKNIVFLENNKYYSVYPIKNQYLNQLWSQNLGVKEIIPSNNSTTSIKCNGERKNKDMHCEYNYNDVIITIKQETGRKTVGVKIKNNKPMYYK